MNRIHRDRKQDTQRQIRGPGESSTGTDQSVTLGPRF